MPVFRFAQYLENKLMEFGQILYMQLILTRSRLGLLSVNFRKLMEFDQILLMHWYWYIVSAQYLQFCKSIEFDQILPVHLYWHHNGWDFHNFSEIHFRSISWEQIDGICPNFEYALILSRLRFGLLHVKICKFITELWTLIDVRISFPLNIFIFLWTHRLNLNTFSNFEKKIMEIDQILYMHWCWQDLGWDC